MNGAAIDPILLDYLEDRPRRWRRARETPTEVLEAIAAQSTTGEGKHDGRITNARGELAERRVVHLLKQMCEVATARQTTQEEDATLTADVVAVLRGGVRVLLQVKSGAWRNSSAKASVRRAKEKGVKVVLAQHAADDAVVAIQVRVALGFEVSGFLGSPVKIGHTVPYCACGTDLRQCGQKVFDFPNYP